ncbi:hypothetical protein FQA39_LY11437 [Lamprigera yunnana]|nr:hypothetical protein FQA39_LY11437 [Lamprigera yunnana]
MDMKRMEELFQSLNNKTNQMNRKLDKFAVGELILKGNETRGAINRCITKVFKEVFNGDKTVFMINTNRADLDFTNISNPMVLYDLSKPMTMTKHLSTQKYFAIYINGVSSLNETYQVLFNVENRYKYLKQGQVVIFTTANLLKFMYISFWNMFFINLVVIPIDQKGAPFIYTSDPHHVENRCGTDGNVMRTQMCDSKLVSQHFYRKLTGCTLRVMDWGLRDTKKSPINFMYLFYIDLMNQYFNVSIEFYNGSKKVNSQALGKLPHITIFYFINTKTQALETSNLLYSANMFWIVPLPPVMPPLVALFSVFKKDVWMLILVSLCSTTAFWFLLVNFRKNPHMRYVIDAFTKTISLTFGGLAGKEPKTFALRCLLMFYLLYIINIQTLYTSNLIRIFTSILYEDGIETLEDLANSNLTIYTKSTDVENYRKNTNFQQELSVKLWKKILVVEDVPPYLHKSSNLRNCAVLIPEIYFHKNRVPNVKIINNNTFTGPYETVFLTFVGHYFIPNFNKFLTFLQEAGVHQKELSNYEKTFYKLQNVTSEDNTAAVALTMEQLQGVFILFGIGLSASCLIFFVELLLSYYQNKQ